MTISYNQLGSNGRLGNQMFQYAALRGIAENREFDWIIPPNSIQSTCDYGLFNCFKMSSVSDKNLGFLRDVQSIIWEDTNFNVDLFNNCPDNINLHGYFQSEKYFKHIENIIRKDFEFEDNILEPCLEIIGDIGESIFLHIRRGDYVNAQQFHPLLSEEYYVEALSKFDSNLPVFVFSDDLEWCKNQEIFKSDRFLLSEKNIKSPNKVRGIDGSYEQSLLPYWDLCLMSLCSGAIIANSSMSWWGAWLITNSDKKVIAPKTWFGKLNLHLNTDDIIPIEWRKI
jgi:hypothetical protein